MDFAIVHLSDIHMQEKNNSVDARAEQLYQAIRNEVLDLCSIFLVISGDIAYSGQENEYQTAMNLIDKLKDKLESYTNCKCNTVIVPGNHDCFHDKLKLKVREIIINNLRDLSEPEDELVSECCQVQSNFFDFSEMYKCGREIYSDKLLKIVEYNLNDYNVIFNCYNTAWLSQVNEEPSKLMFPIQKYEKSIFENKADLIVSIMHHPFNWQNPDNKKIFSRHIEITSDIVLIGHEHQSSSSIVSDFMGNYTEYVEGSVLQETCDRESSGFNIIKYNLKDMTHQILRYKWNENIYNVIENTGVVLYKRSTQLNKKIFHINKNFEKNLNDSGATFTNSHKTTLQLEDFFIFPDLRRVDELNTDQIDKKVRPDKIL